MMGDGLNHVAMPPDAWPQTNFIKTLLKTTPFQHLELPELTPMHHVAAYRTVYTISYGKHNKTFSAQLRRQGIGRGRRPSAA